MRWLTRVVSVVVILAVVGLGYVLLRAKMPKTHVGGAFRAWALFRDGSRLALGSPVMIAGVRVGEVSDLEIAGPFARIDMKLQDDTDVPVDSWITKRAESAFGDSYLEIIPGGGDEGAASARRLRSVARTLPKIDRGLDAVHDFAMTSRKWTSGTLEDTLLGADRWVAEGHIEGPLDAADRAMMRFESGTSRAADAVAGARPEVDRTFDRIDRGISSARSKMADVKTGIHDGLAGARDGMDRIDPTVQQIQDVVEAVNEGSGADFKGQLGRLVNNPELADTLEDVTASVRDGAHSLNPFHSWLGFRAEYNVFSNEPRVYVTAQLEGHHDQFYLLELEKGALGNVPADQLHDVANAAQFNRTQSIDENLRFTAEWGKRFGPVQFRGGLKESTYGLGSDLLLGSGRLTFSTDVFGSFTSTPRVKLYGALEVFRSFYILGGVDDMLNRPGYLTIVTGNTAVPTYFEKLRYGRDYFFGASMKFTDADLTTLLRVYGTLITGLL